MRLNPQSDWPDGTIAFFDDNGQPWCKEHEPKAGEYVGELSPVLKSDNWARDLGVCTKEDCDRLISDLL